MAGFTCSFLNCLQCGLLLLVSCSAVHAQSGRRAPKSSVPPPPLTAPTTTESEQPAAKPKPDQPQQKLIAGIDELSGSLNIPRYLSDAVWNGFLGRFRQVSYIRLSTDEHMGRSEAVKRAKNETESFVVFLRLETDDLSPNASIGQQINLDRLVVNYLILAPGTAKTKGQGQVLVRPSRSVLGKSLPTNRAMEAQMNEAGRAAAERVLSSLNIGSPAIMHLQ